MSGTLIVTGASRGIGAAIARLAGARGFRVAVNFASGQAAAGEVVDDMVAAGGRAGAIGPISAPSQISFDSSKLRSGTRADPGTGQ